MTVKAPPWVLISIALYLVSTLKSTEALCGCAERFASTSDFTNDTSTPYFDNKQNGQNIVFSNARFHCKTKLNTLRYSGVYVSCNNNMCMNSNTISNNQATMPIVQLWRMNDSFYNLVNQESLKKDIDTLDLEWSVMKDDIIGMWIPSSCHCTGDVFKLGYLYGQGGSKVYRIDEQVDSFDPFEYDLVDGPLPMISVKTDNNFNTVCIIGLPAGACITIIAIIFTLVGICWSISAMDKKKNNKKGKFIISHPIQDETEMDEIQITDPSASPQSLHSEQNGRYASNTSNRPIYTQPLPPLPTTNIDDDDEQDFGTRSLSSSPRPSYTGHSAHMMHHSMSNPNLSTSSGYTPHGYGNIPSNKSLTREQSYPQAKPPLAKPRNNTEHTQPPTTSTYPTSTYPTSTYPTSTYPTSTFPTSTYQNTAEALSLPRIPPTDNGVGIQDVIPPPPASPPPTEDKQSYDRNSEYEISDNDSAAGEVHEEYISLRHIDIEGMDG